MYKVDPPTLAKIKLCGGIVVKPQAHYVLLNEKGLTELLKDRSPKFIELCKATAKAAGYPVNMYWSTEKPPEFSPIVDGVDVDYDLLNQIIDVDAVRSIATAGPISVAERRDRFKAIYAKAFADYDDVHETIEWLAGMATESARHKSVWVMRTSVDNGAIGLLMTTYADHHLIDKMVGLARGWYGVLNLMGYDPDKHLVTLSVGPDYIGLSLIDYRNPN